MKIFYSKDGKQSGVTLIHNSDEKEPSTCNYIFYKDKTCNEMHGKHEVSSLKHAEYMFSDSSITSYSANSYNLSYGKGMFCNCENLTSFTGDISNVEDASEMFCNCENIENFTQNTELFKLKNANKMYYNSSLKQFNAFDESYFCSKLEDCTSMFENCKQLEKVNIGERNYNQEVFIADNLCKNCTNLTTFTGSFTVSGQSFDGALSGCNNLKDLSIELKNADVNDFYSLFDASYFDDNHYKKINNLTLELIAGNDDVEKFSKILQDNTGLKSVYLKVTPKISTDEYNFVTLDYIKNGDNLFKGCTNLSYVDGDMQVTSAKGMFSDCKLNAEGLKNVYNFLGYGGIEKKIKKNEKGYWVDITPEDDLELLEQEEKLDTYFYLSEISLGCDESVKENNILTSEIANIIDKEWIVSCNVKPDYEYIEPEIEGETGTWVENNNNYYCYCKFLGQKSDIGKSSLSVEKADELAQTYNATHSITVKGKLRHPLLSRLTGYKLIMYFIFKEGMTYYNSPIEYGGNIKGEAEEKCYSYGGADRESVLNSIATYYFDLLKTRSSNVVYSIVIKDLKTKLEEEILSK